MPLLPIDEHEPAPNRTSTLVSSDANSYVSFPKCASKHSLRRRALSAAHSYREQLNARPASGRFSDINSDCNESFQRLPRISGVSSLKVASILERPASSISLCSSTLLDVSQSGNLSATKPSYKKRTLSTLNIPSLMHPNSPYVPWSSPVRKKILCPLPQDLHHSPERRNNPTFLDPDVESSLQESTVDVEETKSIFRRFIYGTLRKAKRIAKYRARKDPSFQKQVLRHQRNGGNGTGVVNPVLPTYSSTRRPSVASVRSYETHTLSIWLAEQRQLLDVELSFSPLDEHFSHK